MYRKENAFDALQEEHLDIMISLAFKTMAEEEAQRASEEFDREEREEEKAACERAYAQYLEKRRKMEAAERKRRNLVLLRRAAENTCKAAACILLIATVAASIAVAKVEPLRSLVFRFWIELDEEQGAAELYMEADEELAFDVPEGWLGEYYMTYIPEGLEVQYMSTSSSYVQYRDSAGIKLSFDERAADSNRSVNNKNAETWYTKVRGNDAYVISKNNRYTIVWAIEDRYFCVMVWDSTYAEALKIAESVRKIIIADN